MGPRAFHWRSAGCTSRAVCHCDVPDREEILKLSFCDFTCLQKPSSVAWCLQDFCFEITSFYFKPTFFLSCGGDIKNLVFWWKTHLIKNIFNSCVVYCNSLADFSDFLFHWPLEEKKINVLYRTLKQPWILLHKLHPSPAPLLTNPVLFKVWYTPAPHPTPTPNRDLSNYKHKTSRQHIRIILYVKALVFSVATLWTKLKPL